MMQSSLLNTAPVVTASLHFAAGIPGFPHLHDFVMAPWGKPDSPFMLMTAIDDSDVGFVVVSPFVFYPEYEFELDKSTAQRLALTDPADATVMCIVTLGERPQDATVNLLGPIVVNIRSCEACQAVLPHAAHGAQAPLKRAA